MSAYIVEDKTINRLLTHINLANGRDSTGRPFERLGFNCSDPDSLTELAGKLYLMNCDAVDARYGHGSAAHDCKDDPAAFPFDFESCTPIQAYKSACCLRYQCSEGDVPNRPLYKALEEVIADIADNIVRNLPEWNETEWA